METLAITLIQSELYWENAEANRAQFSQKIQNIVEPTDLIVLPEMFTTGFSMNAEALAEVHEGETLAWMQEHAALKNAAITGSVITKENGKNHNRLYFVFPDGSFHYYDKKHTFTLAGEHKIYSAGTEKLIVSYKGWSICPLICYDLRFPVWARNIEDYDILIYCANWPDKRVTAWDALLKARAIENMCYCIGVNRVGLDGNGHAYSGHSAVYDALGEEQEHSNKITEEFVQTIVLEKEHLKINRKHLRFLQDRDPFTLE